MRPARPVRSPLTLLLPRWVCEARAYLNHFVRGGLHTETERVGRRRHPCCFTRDPSVSAATELTLAWDDEHSSVLRRARRSLRHGEGGVSRALGETLASPLRASPY